MYTIDFNKNENIKENIYKMLSEIISQTMHKENATNLVKSLINLIFQDVIHSKNVIVSAAKKFITQLSLFVGPTVFKETLHIHASAL